MLLDHVGIAVDDPKAVQSLFRRLFGADVYKSESIRDQAVRTHFLSGGQVKLELLEALDEDSPVRRFVEKHGAGLHHLAFEVPDVAAALRQARREGFEPLSEEPQVGADGKEIFFLHPRDTHGLLIEFCQQTSFLPNPVHVDCGSHTVSVYEAGRRRRPHLVLLHGIAGSTALETWPLARRLEPYFHVLALDFSGHGTSEDPPPEQPLSWDLFTSNIRAVLDHFNAGSTHVFGFSMGGGAALHFASREPQRVQKAAVLATSPYWDEERTSVMMERLDADYILDQHPGVARELSASHGPEAWTTRLRRCQQFVDTLPTTPPDDLQHLAAPTLVAGYDRDRLFPPSLTLQLADHLPHARLAIFPGHRHALHELDLDAATPLLTSWFTDEAASLA